MDKLERVLSSFLGQIELVGQLSRVLSCIAGRDSISYGEIKGITGDEPEDVLLLGHQWRLLIPVRSIKGTMEWDERVLLAESEEP